MTLSAVFINLPDLVYQQIMKYMDFDSLKSLRATCKTTKSWVETEENLKHFNIHIFSSKFLYTELFKSEMKWSSFTFSIENPFGQNISALSDFLHKYGDDIKVLFFATSKLIARDDYFQPVCIITILESCPNLRSLTMEDFDILNCSNDTLQKLVRNWERLEVLKVRGFKYLKCSSKQSGFFTNIFSNCSHLQELQLPRTMYGEGETDEHHDRFVIQPLIDHLDLRGKYLKNLKYLNIHRNDSRDDDKPSIRKLARICADWNITLLGNSSTVQKIIDDLEDEDCTRVARIVGTINTINDNMILMEFDNLQELRLESKNISIFNLNYDLPQFPRLTSVNFLFSVEYSSAFNPRSYLLFISKFMQTKRDSIKRFSARVIPPDNPNPEFPCVDMLFIKASDLVNNFRNLRELSLQGWMAEDDEFLMLWSGLPNLERLFLQRCENLTDRGFLGDERKQPAILQLKRLKQMFLAETPKLTDRFYNLAVKHMKLKYFFTSMKRSGFQILSKGPFAKSIQYFTRPTVELDEGVFWQVNNFEYRDISVESYGFENRTSCRKYLKKFKNLREPNIDTWEFKRPVGPCTIS